MKTRYPKPLTCAERYQQLKLKHANYMLRHKLSFNGLFSAKSNFLQAKIKNISVSLV